MLRRSHSSIQQFEIKLDNNTGKDDDVVLLSGIPVEAASAPLTGTLVYTTMDASKIKSVSLKLVGNLKVYYSESGVQKHNHMPLKFEKCIYEDEIKDFEIPGRVVSGSSLSQRNTPASSLTSLTSYFGVGKKHNENNKLLSPLNPLTSSSSTANLQSTHQIGSGSYKFPFEMIIPGDVKESIESNRYCQVTYNLIATINKGLGQQNLVATKKVYVVRTLGVDNYDIAHTVSVDNTWPKKVDYSIRVPCKAAPFGSQLEVQFTIVPLAKGLKLGDIHTEIEEYVTITPPSGGEKKEECRTVSIQDFKVPENFDHMSDVWQLLHRVKLPKSLTVCSQDADIDPYIKINHKFACKVSLMNKDGHRSELRASLPITLYISPHVNVFHSSKPEKALMKTESGKPYNKHEKPLFRSETSNTNLARLPDLRAVQDYSAPPDYSRSAQDRILSNEATPLNSPPISRPDSPSVIPSPNSISSLNPNDQAQLAAGLRQLVLTKQNSRPNGSLTSPNSQISLAALSRVPSYEEALHGRALADAAPDYSD